MIGVKGKMLGIGERLRGQVHIISEGYSLKIKIDIQCVLFKYYLIAILGDLNFSFFLLMLFLQIFLWRALAEHLKDCSLGITLESEL